MLRFILAIAVFGTLSCSKDAPVSPPRAGKARADDVASDRAALVASYKATNGDNWKDNTNWLSEKSLAFWYGVSTDSEGRVKSLQLEDNNLVGSIPAELGQLTKLERLLLSNNQLTGCIPNTLRNFTFPEGEDFDRLEILFCGEDDQLDRAALIAFYQATGGSNWKNKTNWLTDAPLDEWHGVDVDAFGRVTAIRLDNNGLQGAIPPEIKELTALKGLWLGYNQLTDVAEVGHLTGLTQLFLHNNGLYRQPSFANLFTAFQGSEEELSESGRIPSTFAQLTNLQTLWLSGNQITGIECLYFFRA